MSCIQNLNVQRTSLNGQPPYFPFQFGRFVSVSSILSASHASHVLVRGEVEYVVAFGHDKKRIGSVFLISTAKASQDIETDFNQLLLSMALVQRASERKACNTVYGLWTDSHKYRFAYLDGQRNSFVTPILPWTSQKTVIIAYFDQILVEILDSAPPFEICLPGNYWNIQEEKGPWKIGPGSDCGASDNGDD